MGGELAVALVVFAACAALVIFCGAKLAVYGDALATLTGWGRLFVGSLLVALATSLPELATNISAVTLEIPNPELAVGNVLGANMLNMFTLSAVALAFGGKRFIENVAPEQGFLILVAAVMTGAAVIFGAVKMDVELWQVGLSSVVLLVIFVAGMKLVYDTRPAGGDDDEDEDPGMTLKKAWLMFGLVSVGVVVAGYWLAWSTDQIAEITGVASSTLGILAVSFVTTMPEAASTIASARIGAFDLGVAGLYGSCAFNVTILFYADIFYRGGILGNQTEPAHFAAGGVAIALIIVGGILILARNRIKGAVISVVLALMASTYIAGAAAVIALGASEDEDDGQASATVPTSLPPPPK